jgi:hypothetical protein
MLKYINVFQWYIGDIAIYFKRLQCIFDVFGYIWMCMNVFMVYFFMYFNVFILYFNASQCIWKYLNAFECIW